MKLAIASAAFGGMGPVYDASGKGVNKPQRTVVIMFDGFGLDYLQQSDMPILRRWQRDGVYQQVRGVMPSVTKANNASICCGCFPREHGITGNSYFDMTADHEEYMEAADLLLAPTLFEHAAKVGVSSALLSSKKKTISLLRRGTATSLTAEEASAEWVDRLGPAPPIYSREINYWIVRAAIYILKRQPELQCLYVHTTDYPMHTWAPDAAESKEHLKSMDTLLGEAYEAAPDAQFLLTADHGMNHKTRAYDLEKKLARAGLEIRTLISTELDSYVQPPLRLGGAAWIYLKHPEDKKKVKESIQALNGVESVLTREEAVSKFSLYGSRIGDLCVFGDKNTVFGELEQATDTLPDDYRSHGSMYELDIPLFVFNSSVAPPKSYFKHNLDLTRWLYRA
jgi:phosphonoacetate hydrolase